MPGASAARIVLIDGGQERLAGFAATLQAAGYAVTLTQGGLDGLVAVEEVQPALVLLPWSLAFVRSEIVIAAIHAGLDDPPNIVVLAEEGVDPTDIHRAGAYAVLPVSVDTETLLRAVRDRNT
jgi:DNA-binding NtrC family response regulator